MGPLFSVLLMINNYCHDIATAMLMASGVTMWVIIRRLENTGSPEGLSLLFSLYGSISRIVTFSLIWIAAGAVPRILTFSTFEFANALAENHLPGLMTKHIFSFAMTLAGAYLWISLIKRIKEIKGRAL
jgi:hypothetical protein